MSPRLIAIALLVGPVATANVVRDVRTAIARNDFTLAEAHVAKYRSVNGVTGEMIEALSWLGRGALASGDLDRAEGYATETQKLSLEQLKTRTLDAESRLPIGLGAAIEVLAQVMAKRGERSAAVGFLRAELERYRTTSIRTRIQKNIHLLSLEGKAAPPLELRQWLGPKPSSWAELRGRAVLLFFWAHWCGDCRRQGPVLARLQAEFDGKGLMVLGPTQRYGYVARGEEAGPERELQYIAEVRSLHYPELSEVPVPVSEDTFKAYGASTTPTLVLVDRSGIVRMYHPGWMPYEELAAKVREVVGL